METPEEFADNDIHEIWVKCFSPGINIDLNEEKIRRKCFEIVSRILLVHKGDENPEAFKDRYTSYIRNFLSDPLRLWEKKLQDFMNINADKVNSFKGIGNALHNLVALSFAQTLDSQNAINCANRQLRNYTDGISFEGNKHGEFQRLDFAVALYSRSLAWQVQRNHNKRNVDLFRTWKLLNKFEGIKIENEVIVKPMQEPFHIQFEELQMRGDVDDKKRGQAKIAEFLAVIELDMAIITLMDTKFILENGTIYKFYEDSNTNFSHRRRLALKFLTRVKELMNSHEMSSGDYISGQVLALESLLFDTTTEHVKKVFDFFTSSNDELSFKNLIFGTKKINIELKKPQFSSFLESARPGSKDINIFLELMNPDEFVEIVFDLHSLNKQSQAKSVIKRFFFISDELLKEHKIMSLEKILIGLLKKLIEIKCDLADRLEETGSILDELGAHILIYLIRIDPSSINALDHVEMFLENIISLDANHIFTKIGRIKWPISNGNDKNMIRYKGINDLLIKIGKDQLPLNNP